MTLYEAEALALKIQRNLDRKRILLDDVDALKLWEGEQPCDAIDADHWHVTNTVAHVFEQLRTVGII